MDSEEAGSGGELKTEDRCVIADWREQSSNTRDWVAGWHHFHHAQACTYAPMSPATIHPSRLAAPSSGERSWANLALQDHKSHHLLCLWTIKCFIVCLLGKNEVISVLFQSVSRSTYSIFFLSIFFLIYTTFIFLEHRKRKIHFYFQFLLKIFFFNFFYYIFNFV